MQELQRAEFSTSFLNLPLYFLPQLQMKLLCFNSEKKEVEESEGCW